MFNQLMYYLDILMLSRCGRDGWHWNSGFICSRYTFLSILVMPPANCLIVVKAAAVSGPPSPVFKVG